MRAVVLILANANGLGVNLDQFCQRILEPPGDGNCGTQIHIIVREFRSGQGRGRVNGSTCFVDDHVAGIRERLQQLYGHSFRFPGSGSVADGNVLDPMLAHQTGENFNGFLLFMLAEGGVDHSGVQHLTGGVHNGNLAAVAVSGVQTHGDKALHRRLHQKRFQVQCKVMDGTGVGPVGQFAADFSLNGGENQPLIGIFCRCPNKGGNLHGGLQSGTTDQCGAFVSGQCHIWLENAFFFSPVHCQNLVVQKPGNGLGEIVVQLVHALFFRTFVSLAYKYAPTHHQIPQ